MAKVGEVHLAVTVIAGLDLCERIAEVDTEIGQARSQLEICYLLPSSASKQVDSEKWQIAGYKPTTSFAMMTDDAKFALGF